MEKRTPHYSLKEVQKVFMDPDNLRHITGVARNGARLLNLSNKEIVNVIQDLSIRDFYKSMTSYGNHRIWQDVYFPSHEHFYLYVKFSWDEGSNTYWLLSFKKGT